jgi:hypothetical protein
VAVAAAMVVAVAGTASVVAEATSVVALAAVADSSAVVDSSAVDSAAIALAEVSAVDCGAGAMAPVGDIRTPTLADTRIIEDFPRPSGRGFLHRTRWCASQDAADGLAAAAKGSPAAAGDGLNAREIRDKVAQVIGPVRSRL